LEIFPVERGFVMVIPDQASRLKAVDQGVLSFQLPVRVGFIPPTVEPDTTDRAVIGK
jgi:hypothetical protein